MRPDHVGVPPHSWVERLCQAACPSASSTAARRRCSSSREERVGWERRVSRAQQVATRRTACDLAIVCTRVRGRRREERLEPFIVCSVGTTVEDAPIAQLGSTPHGSAHASLRRPRSRSTRAVSGVCDEPAACVDAGGQVGRVKKAGTRYWCLARFPSIIVVCSALRLITVAAARLPLATSLHVPLRRVRPRRRVERRRRHGAWRPDNDQQSDGAAQMGRGAERDDSSSRQHASSCPEHGFGRYAQGTQVSLRKRCRNELRVCDG
jgi:hypothetical protein